MSFIYSSLPPSFNRFTSLILLSMGVFLMDSQIQNNEVVGNEIKSSSSITNPSKSSSSIALFEIFNPDIEIDPSRQCNSVEIPLVAENNSHSAIDSSNQASRSRISIINEDSISDSVMEEAQVPFEKMPTIGTSDLSMKDRYSVSINVLPNVPQEFTPVVGSKFQTVGHCIDMYKKYADYAGFDIRRSTERTFRDKSVRLKYLVCHRYGLPNKRSVDSINLGESRKVLRNSNFKVTGCQA